ncbi:invasion associated locus B family protein [Ruegeria sp. ANG10]|uniref:invasion associated locus B family protein n=1 Tax=Ruegeria sp. ANG10 TaxID=3042467 RepID=UPI0034565D64
MIKNTLSLSLVAAALCTGAVYAQESQPENEVPQTEAGSELDLGETGPRVGEQYVKEEFGDWNLTCLKLENGDDPCLLRQILSGPEGQPIAEITIEKLPEGVTAVGAASVTVPLETTLQAQIAMSIDGAPGKRYNYHHCNPVGCVAQLGFAQNDIDAMKAGTTATLSWVSVVAPQQLQQAEISLAGFTKGFEILVPFRR